MVSLKKRVGEGLRPYSGSMGIICMMTRPFGSGHLTSQLVGIQSSGSTIFLCFAGRRAGCY